MEKSKFDAIVAIPFGVKTGEGSANWHIANRAVALAREQCIPMVAHVRLPVKTVAARLPAHERELLPHVELIDGRTVLEIARNFYGFAGYETWNNILLVSMPYVAERSMRDIEKVSGGRFAVEQEEELEKLDPFMWFNASDRQFIVRHPIMWHLSEIALCCMPWAMYQKCTQTKQ